MESIPEGEKARICLFYAKKQSPFTLQNLCAGTGWDHFSDFFLVLFNIWSSPFAGKRCAEQCVWGRVRERESWLMPCGPWCWYHFVPESSDPEWKAILFLSQMNHLPRHTLCPMVSPWPFSFPRLLCWVGTCLHITSQQPSGQETCFSYNQLKIFTWVWEFIAHQLPTWCSTGRGGISKKSPKPTQRREGWERWGLVGRCGLGGPHTLQHSMSKSHLGQASKNLSLACMVSVSGWGYEVVCWGLVQVSSPVSSHGTFTLQLLWNVLSQKAKVCYIQSGVRVGLGWLLCETNQLGCTGQITSQKAKFSCPCLDGDTIQRYFSLGCLLPFCLRDWTETASLPLWSNKDMYKVKCGRKIIAQRWGNGLFVSVSTGQGFLSPERCPQTVCPLFSPTLCCQTFLWVNLRGLLEIFRADFSLSFSEGEAGHFWNSGDLGGKSVWGSWCSQSRRQGLAFANEMSSIGPQVALPGSKMHWPVVRSHGLKIIRAG